MYKQRRLLLLTSLLLAGVLPAAAQDGGREVVVTTADGVSVYGDRYDAAAGLGAPVILLFHQGAGDARGEYASHVPVLLAEGYNVLAFDLRSGGDRFGGVNRTVAQLGASVPAYCAAYPDLAAALDYVNAGGYAGKRIVWGSSYSAALAIQLAARAGEEVSAVLAFSPASGEPLADCLPEQFLDRLTAPLLALRPAREMAIESVQRQMALFAEAGHATYVAEGGVHGSSMLNPARAEGTAAHWAVVLRFLAEVTATP